jgi:hypothetical protein
MLLPPLPDPTDLVLAGEQMRISVNDQELPAVGSVMQGAQIDTDWLSVASTLLDEDAFLPMNSLIEGSMLGMRRQKGGVLQMRSGAGIATPTGAWVWLDYTPLLAPLLWASNRWVISGTTRDSFGAPLGNCRVIVLETGHLAVGQAQAVLAEGVSDGSGAFSIEVPQNTAYEVIAYLAGAPDRAGIGVNTLTPTANG